MRGMLLRLSAIVGLSIVVLAAGQPTPPADLVLLGRVYTLSWDEPSPEGKPGAKAPFADGAWHPGDRKSVV